MRKYETVLVFHPELNKDRLAQEIGTIKDLLSGNGAQAIEFNHWGKREMAYLAKKQKQGSYVLLEYQAPAGDSKVIGGLAAALRINDRVLKFQTHRINDHMRKFKGNPKRAQRSGEDEGVFGEEDFS